MAVQTEAERWSAQRRRQSNQRLYRQIVQFQSGQGKIEELRDTVSNDGLSFSLRLEVIEAALRGRMIEPHDLTGVTIRPEYFDYGLSTDKAPTVLPVWLRSEDNSKITNNLGVGIILAVCTIASCIWLLQTFHTVWSLIGLPILVFGSIFIVMSILVLLVSAINFILPGASSYRKFKADCSKYEAVVASRLIWDRQDEVMAYQTNNGLEFERLVARAFRRSGFQVEEFGGVNDGGVDLIVWKGGVHGIVQCKAFKRPVGPAVVRELFGTLAHHDGATIAYLATTNGVTQSARDWCNGKPIKIVTPDHLVLGKL